MKSIGIIALTVASCVIYGVLHDQITARICIEYFTIGHPPIFPTQDPTLIGLGWGVIATWWVGFILGISLAIVSRVGASPKITASQLFRPILFIMSVSAAFSIATGIVGFVAARNGWVYLVGAIANQVPADKQTAFITDLWAHSGSYFAGFVGGAILILRTWRLRRGQIQ